MRHPYTKEGRLEIVVAMIQILGLGDHPRGKGEVELHKRLRLGKEEKVWEIALEHPEFFHVTGEGGAEGTANKVTCLIARSFNQDRKQPLSEEYVKSLIDTARELHDRQWSRSQDWRFWVAIILAAFGGIVTSMKVVWDLFTS